MSEDTLKNTINKEEEFEPIYSELLKNRIDIKAETIANFNHVFSMIRKGKIEGASTNAQVFLVTPQGLVTGDIGEITTDNNAENALEKFMEPVIISNRNKNLNELVEENPNIKPINDSSIIVVRNAQLLPWSNYNSPIEFQVLYLFASDISGFTLGNFANR